MEQPKQYVWYASYGSNINNDRFLCYIKGGKPNGSSMVEEGCRDQSLPIKESIHLIKHPLYFAKESGRWNFQGVAFIGLYQDSSCITYSKKYLITTEQFMDIVKQENDGIKFKLNLQDVQERNSYVFNEESWYGNILYLGKDSGYPIYTFTAPWDKKEVDWKKPSHSYLSTIIKGLRKDYSTTDVFDYLASKPGIKESYQRDELLHLIKETFD
ncbi:hypothetical protein FS935_18515 [Metabacillus litoralis]|uniref:Histone deacetylase n=1 Tax=Metabacillus litoralis TaxID=152268 RepID=A0A5C6VMQ6_9BACI|nr:hypothetical protein [Metabacillus litoralis]TXC86044.1 hypothetical protein FS935_18515 [Metabacillus litoralis]